jgi:adenylate cyclase
VFGVPLDDPQAASHAVTCAREILAEIDRRGLGAGQWPLRIGIGLDVGQVVTGNVGSPRRKEFTVIGDAVNMASRLEQLNKELGTRLLVSDAVARAAATVLGPATSLGAIAIKGYAQPVQVWRLDP